MTFLEKLTETEKEELRKFILDTIAQAVLKPTPSLSQISDRITSSVLNAI